MEEKRLIPKLRFKGSWRSYQKRVLDELDFHLNDKKLNVVAAPGAGKTILGIEVLCRLKSSAFILAPTITIKNQWKQRIIDNFLAKNQSPDLISTDIKNISEITISTYQGLYSIYQNKEEKEKFITDLKAKNINTLILDEAHHLRTQWWAALNDLTKELENNENFKIVALTGTPPYDVPPAEWQNYNSLCGNVDAEISIPELVKSGDLCPHQDLIYFSDLTKEERKTVFDFEKNKNEFLRYMKESSDIIYSVNSSSFAEGSEIIYKNIDFTISVISYLLNLDELSQNAVFLCEYLSISKEQIPKFDTLQAQTLVNGIIGEFSSHFKNVLQIKNKLRKYKLLNGNKADFTGETDFKKLFARSKNKLSAIYEITKFESSNLKKNLREVILLDFIGKGDSEGVNILSVYEKLTPLSIPLSILTGSLITIPTQTKNRLYEILTDRHIDHKKVLTSEFDEKSLRIEVYGNVDIVSVITQMFSEGEINILIGTTALLGEGWDSPSTNTLILGSTVGSFMLSNQMRGRALRIDKNNLQKTSDIWHLASLEQNSELSPDFLTIVKRFNSFEGISYMDKTIQNGIARLNFENTSNLNCTKLNEKMFDYAKDRAQLKEKWEQVFKESALTQNKMIPMVYEILKSGKTQKLILLQNQDNNSFIGSIINKISLSRRKSKLNFFEKQFLKTCLSLKLIDSNYEKIIEDNWEIFKKETILKNLALSLLDVLCELYIIKTKRENIRLKLNENFDSDFYLTIFGCSNFERNVFIEAFAQIFKINEKNRYILKRENTYFAVPECLSGNKKNAELFVGHIEYFLGYIDLIFTRNPEGRKELLKAIFALDEGKLSIQQSRIWI